MNVQISLALLLVASVISFQGDDGVIRKARKHYGLSYHTKCIDYVKSFTCMTTCKSIGFQVFRMDFRCKCSCHELKTTTILPFFKWRTNGTTKTLPSTGSPQLYHIAGTMSPGRTFNDTKIIETTTNAAIPICDFPPTDNSTASNSTSDDGSSGNATAVGDVSASGDPADGSDSSSTTTTSAGASASESDPGGNDAAPPGDDAPAPADVPPPPGDDTTPANDDTQPGDDNPQPGDDDAK